MILIKVQYPENTPAKRPASKGLLTRQAEGRDRKAGIGRSGIKKARDTKRSAANGPVDESYKLFLTSLYKIYDEIWLKNVQDMKCI